MTPDLRRFLEGTYESRSKNEKVSFLGACQFEGRYTAAAEIYAEVLFSDTQLADDVFGGTRFRAACTAAAAGAGRDRDADSLDEEGRARWRKQARDWLRADLEESKRLSKSAKNGLQGFLKDRLKNWLTDPDLSALQDRDVCKGLLPAEQNEFQRLCDELRVLADQTKG